MGLLTLSAMARGDRRLPADPEVPLAALAWRSWPHDAGSLQLFRYSSNFLYTFSDRGARRFLRAVPDHHRSRAQAAAELDLLTWLQAQGVDVVSPIPSCQGNLLETVALEEDAYHTVVFAELAGEQRELEHLTGDDLSRWGAALGQLHAALRRYPGAAAADRPSWRDDLDVAARRLLPRCPSYRAEFDAVARALAELPRTSDVYGLIHFDCELDNLLWHEESLAILDFDDCAHHWYAADIAFALRDVFDTGVNLTDWRIRAFLAGYAAHQAIDDAMIGHLPLFSRLARLTQAGRVARALDLDPQGTYPAWLRDLESRLAQMLPG